MVKWNSPTPLLDQQPTSPAVRATVSAMETALVLVKLMENGLGIRLLVNVSTCRCNWNICAFTSPCLQSVSAVIKCSSLDDPANGQVELSNTTVGSSANYTCTRGYILSNGNNTRTCEADGEWSGDTPICERKSWVFVHSQVDWCVLAIYLFSDWLWPPGWSR